MNNLATDNEIKVRITGENEDLIDKLHEVVIAINNAKNSSDNATHAVGGFSSKLANLGMITTGVYAGLTMLTAAVKNTIGAVLNYNSNMEDSEAAFEVFLGNTKLATQYLSELKRIAADTPFDLPGVTDAGKKLLAFGFDAQTSLSMLRTIGDTAAGLGIGREGVGRITLALGQIKAKGRVMGDELLQLTEAGIPAYTILAEKLHLTADQVKNIGNQGIDADTAIKALTEGMDERFHGMAKKLSDRMHGLVSTIKDNLASIGGYAFNPLFSALENGLTKVRDFTDQFSNAINGLGSNLDENSGALRFVASLQVGIQKAVDLFTDLTKEFGTYDKDGVFHLSDDTLDKVEQLGDLLESAYGLALNIGSAFVKCSPIIAEIASAIGYWIQLLINVANVIVNLVKGGADKANASFTTTKTIIDTIVGVLAEFFIIKTIIGMVSGLATAFLAVKAAVIGVVKKIQLATITQLAFNAVAAIAKNPYLAVGLAAAGAVGYGVYKGGGFDGIINTIEQKASKMFSNLSGIKDNVDTKVQELLKKANATNTKQPYPTHKTTSTSGTQVNEKLAKSILHNFNSKLKAFLDKQLQAYKDQLEELDILYKQNQLSDEEYYTKRAQVELAEAQERLNATNALINKIQNSSLDAKEKAGKLDALSEKQEKYTKEVKKATSALHEVASVFKNAAPSQQFSPEEISTAQNNIKNSKAVLGPYGNQIMDYSMQYGVDPRLVWSIMKQESGFNPNARSSAGAIGLMQLMPSTAKSLGISRPYNADENIHGGVMYIAQLLQRFNGDFEKVIAAYNAGPNAVEKYNGTPPYAETEGYIKAVNNNLAQISRKIPADLRADFNIAHAQDATDGFGDAIDSVADKMVEADKKVYKYGDNMCTTFAKDVLAATGYSQKLGNIGYSSWVPTWYKNAKSKGIVQNISADNKPQAGDIMFSNWDSAPNYTHVLIADGKGGAYGASHSYSRAFHYDNYKSSFPDANEFIHIPRIKKNPVVTTKLALEAKNAQKKTANEFIQNEIDYNSEIGNIYGQYDWSTKKKLLNLEKKKQKAEAQHDTKQIKLLEKIIKETSLSSKAKAASKNVEIKLKELNYKTTSIAGDIAYGMTDVNNAVKSYYNAIGEKGLNIQYELGLLEKELSHYYAENNLSKAQEIRDKINSVKQSIADNLNKFIDSIEKNAQWQSDMIDANFNLTDRQKSKLKKDINYNAAGQKAAILKIQLQNQRNDYELKMEDYNTAYDNYNTASDNDKKSAKSNLLLKQISLQNAQYTMQATQRQIEYNEELAKVPTLMQEIGAAGKNALHDGLVTFLTEGINKADNLKDAFLDMIHSILESMQKVLAESIANDFMRSLFGPTEVITIPEKGTWNTTKPTNRATGGYINGGTPGKDSVPVMAMPGEFVVKTKAVSNLVKKYGNGVMHMINSGTIPESINAAKIKSGMQDFINRYNNGSLYNFHVNVPKYADGGYIGKSGSNALNGTMDKFAFNISNSSKTPIVNTHIQNVVDSKQLEGFITTTVVKNSKLYSTLFKQR